LETVLQNIAIINYVMFAFYTGIGKHMWPVIKLSYRNWRISKDHRLSCNS